MSTASPTGGQTAIRGFVAQTLVAILDLASKPFVELTLEPDIGGEKFDILRRDEDGSLHARQIKTTKNSFSESQLTKWASEMLAQRNGEHCSLMLLGNIPPDLQKISEVQGVAVFWANLHIEASCTQAAQHLADFLEREGLPQGGASERRRTVDGLLGMLLRDSIFAKGVTKAGFAALLKEWIRSIPEPAKVDWPEAIPQFPWEVADQFRAREAFEKLVTRSAPHRLLTLCGATETGKTLLTKEFLGHAQRRLSDCLAGRFDFGSSRNLVSRLLGEW